MTYHCPHCRQDVQVERLGSADERCPECQQLLMAPAHAVRSDVFRRRIVRLSAELSTSDVGFAANGEPLPPPDEARRQLIVYHGALCDLKERMIALRREVDRHYHGINYPPLPLIPPDRGRANLAERRDVERRRDVLIAVQEAEWAAHDELLDMLMRLLEALSARAAEVKSQIAATEALPTGAAAT